MLYLAGHGGSCVRYTYRLRPGAQAVRALETEWHRCRFLGNEAVHQQCSGGRPTFVRLSNMLTEARGRNAWLRAGSQVVQQQMLRTFAQALDYGQAPSKGYQRAKLQAARLHKKTARQNTHEARQWARRVVADHQTIAVEDFKPKFLARSTMARKAADAAIGAAKQELIEHATRAGRKVVLVAPAYTTMTCADRDRNAAAVIPAATVELDRASADDVRHCEPPSGAVSGAVRAGNPPASAMGKS
ncbi:hypothetical protein [Nocardia carnea]|uniref:hypothetical protein n=1 Tax=Nocardia carnea TaxID=37328 RepID=UPI002457FDC4|nr:hypothetical protein [Nocardia carnea]